MSRNRRYPKSDREDVLVRVAHLVQSGKWITLDTETTGRGFEDQVIEVAICEPVLPELPTHTWRIRPTIAITEKATEIHGIRIEDLESCPTYAECWPQIEATINKRKNVMYNAEFDYRMLFMSARAHNMSRPYIWTGQCAMQWYAVYHGELFGYDGYKYQSLEDACQQMEVPIEGRLHCAATDAKLTAKLLIKLAEIAQRDIPHRL